MKCHKCQVYICARSFIVIVDYYITFGITDPKTTRTRLLEYNSAVSLNDNIIYDNAKTPVVLFTKILTIDFD